MNILHVYQNRILIFPRKKNNAIYISKKQLPHLFLFLIISTCITIFHIVHWSCRAAFSNLAQSRCPEIVTPRIFTQCGHEVPQEGVRSRKANVGSLYTSANLNSDPHAHAVVSSYIVLNHHVFMVYCELSAVCEPTQYNIRITLNFSATFTYKACNGYIIL